MYRQQSSKMGMIAVIAGWRRSALMFASASHHAELKVGFWLDEIKVLSLSWKEDDNCCVVRERNVQSKDLDSEKVLLARCVGSLIARC